MSFNVGRAFLKSIISASLSNSGLGHSHLRFQWCRLCHKTKPIATIQVASIFDRTVTRIEPQALFEHERRALLNPEQSGFEFGCHRRLEALPGTDNLNAVLRRKHFVHRTLGQVVPVQAWKIGNRHNVAF